MLIRHYYTNVAVVYIFSRVNLLNRAVAQIGRIALALNGVPDIILYGNNINALITASFCNFDFGKTAFTQQLGTPPFKTSSA